MCSDSISTTRPSRARFSSVGSNAASQARSVTESTSPSRFDSVSSGPNTLKVSGFFSTTSRRNLPSTRVASPSVFAGSGTSTA